MEQSARWSVAAALFAIGAALAAPAHAQEAAKHKVTAVAKVLVDDARVAVPPGLRG